jgi:hypothetical protein
MCYYCQAQGCSCTGGTQYNECQCEYGKHCYACNHDSKKPRAGSETEGSGSSKAD